LVPLKVSVPVPVLTSALEVLPFWITPLNVVDVLSPPAVRVPLWTVPAPASEPIA
jgi:hypothetical protein